ncbi:MAG: hypothetical protein D6702_05265 [Planctomycetota bacterium]|nr:MAG: hypothetical protein D6702_05265 [Planctomycetota bacterium]
MESADRPAPFLHRAALGLAAGGLLGLAIGAVESCLLLTAGGMGVREPLAEMLRIEAYYVVAAAGLGLVLHLLILRRSLAATVRVLLAAAAALLGVVWVRAWLSGGESVTFGMVVGSYAGGLAAVAAAWLAGRVLFRRPAPALILGLVAFGLAHGVALVGTGHAGGPDLGIQPWRGERPPNIAVLLIDTLRADRLGCYGYERPTSPEIDALAARGTRFEAAYAQASWTRPSVASLMTSLYPDSHDIRGDYDVLPAGLPTLAQVLKARGYHTAGFSANPQVSPLYGFDRGFDVFGRGGSHLLRRSAIGILDHMAKRTLRMRILPALTGGGAAATAGKAGKKKAEEKDPLAGSGAQALNRQVFQWLDDYDGRQPFFLYVQYIDPHTPYSPPEDLINEGGQEPVSLPAQFIDKNAPPYPLSSYEAAPPEVLAGLSRLYDAEVRYVDREIGRLLNRLAERGLLEDTIVVVTADHGEELYDHEQWLHGQSLFDELVRVPLIVAGPGVARQVVEEPVELIDLLPTAAGWSGAEIHFPIQGRDLGPILAGGGGDPERVVFSERQGAYPLHAVRRGRDKLIRITSPDGPVWLQYDLGRDPGERRNLAAEGGPAAELRELLERTVAAAGALLGERAAKVEATGAAADELKALGYIGDEG